MGYCAECRVRRFQLGSGECEGMRSDYISNEFKCPSGYIATGCLGEEDIVEKVPVY